jgi:hypothetical protein
MYTVDTAASMTVKPLQARKLDNLFLPYTLPVWHHQDSFKCMEWKTKTVADMMGEPPQAPRKLDNLFLPYTRPGWNHKNNFQYV